MLENNPSIYICKPRNTQKYPKYPEIPKSKKDTRKYPIVYLTLLPDPTPTRYPVFCPIPDPRLKNLTRWALIIFRHSYPTRTRPATRYFVQYPTRPDTEKPYPLGTAHVVMVNLSYPGIFLAFCDASDFW